MAEVKIPTEAIDQYHRDGATVLRSLVDADWRRRLGAAIDADIQSPGPFVHGYDTAGGKGRFHGNLRTWETDDTFREFCLTSPLPEIAARFLGSEKVNLLYDQLFVKEPGTPNPTRWHNDQPYWAIRGWKVLSIWIALDPTTAETGAMEFIRGSHQWDRWFQPETFGKTAAHGGYEENPKYEPMPDIEAARGGYDIVSWDLAPGDAYVFHALTVHGAGGNHSHETRRRGYTVRYTGDDVVYDTRPGTNLNLRSDQHADGDPLDGERFPVVWRR